MYYTDRDKVTIKTVDAIEKIVKMETFWNHVQNALLHLVLFFSLFPFVYRFHSFMFLSALCPQDFYYWNDLICNVVFVRYFSLSL